MNIKQTTTKQLNGAQWATITDLAKGTPESIEIRSVPDGIIMVKREPGYVWLWVIYPDGDHSLEGYAYPNMTTEAEGPLTYSQYMTRWVHEEGAAAEAAKLEAAYA